MPNASVVRWFCRVYSVLLYAYPRAFRLQYGGEMAQVFRDRCGYVARRQALLRPCHTDHEFLAQIADHSGLKPRHRESLDALA